MAATAIASRITGFSVRKPGESQAASVTEDAFVPEADRRLRLETVPKPLSASMRWQKRPHFFQGNDSRTYMVDSPNGLFGVEVGHVENGHKEPFEVWVKGDEAPRGLSALAKSLSMDMRSHDRGWLRKKLESLAKVKGDAFNFTMPDGNEYRMPSAVAAFARLILFRCEELGAFERSTQTPILDALASKREPKTQATGATTHSFDIANVRTEETFLLTLKEAVYPDGTRRPFSVWLAGDYPKSLDGLCKSLSLDMRVVEIAWPIRKLKQLLDTVEPNGDFMAQIPGSEKSTFYPSTIAYIAAVILHRYKVLGLVDDEGAPSKETGVLSIEDARAQRVAVASQPHGEVCGNCQGVNTLDHSGGCTTCRACGDSKCS